MENCIYDKYIQMKKSAFYRFIFKYNEDKILKGIDICNVSNYGNNVVSFAMS